MKHFQSIVWLLSLLVSGLAGVTTMLGAVSLQTHEEYPLTRVGASTFFGINAIYAEDSVIVIASNPDVFRSTNSGLTWQTIADPLSFRHITSILPLGDTIYAGAANGGIHRTTNHGLIWKLHSRSGTSGPLTELSRNGQEIVGVSDLHSGFVSRSAMQSVEILDSTITLTMWTGLRAQRKDADLMNVTALVATDSLVFVAKRRDGIFELNPLDGAQSAVNLDYLKGEFITSLVVQDSYLYAGVKLGKGGVHRKHIDGRDWENVFSDRDNGIVEVTTMVPNYRGIYVGTREHGIYYIGRSSRIMRSICDGLAMGMAQTISVVDSSLIIGCRLRGVFLLPNSRAVIRLLSPTIPQSPEYMVGTFGSSLVVGLGNGSIISSSDDGRTWDSLPSPFPQASLNTVVGRGPELIASTTNGAWVTADTGRNWKSMHAAFENVYVHKVIVDDSVTIVITSERTFFLRPDGQMYEFDTTLSVDHPSRVIDAVVADGKIYAVGYPGLMVSKDLGRTWSVHTVPKMMVFRTVAVTKKTIYVATDMGYLLSCPLP
ncbi:MAG TPA: hypothetical protein VK147_08040 [Candidatus Didemnitutus sp.]|nr:hypothetical protein [Candidatus Didemnitutus sp.]